MDSTGVGTAALSEIFIGIDIGTSGCRAIAINNENHILAKATTALPDSQLKAGHITQQAHHWWSACQRVMENLLSQIPREHVKSIAIDATSGSALLCDIDGIVLSDAFMYNDKNNLAQAALIEDCAPNDSAAHGASSGLAKCLSLIDIYKPTGLVKCLNQADWIAGVFTDQYNFSDQNNSLKMGYDVINQQWPSWLNKLNCRDYLVENVYAPGEIFASITPKLAKKFRLPASTRIVAGTTDSIAAFNATNSHNTGDAVTSLGSTLAIKIISSEPVFAPEFGVYSHRFGKHWLVGGASNSGGAVLKKYFNTTQITEMSSRIQPDKSTELHYYPLLEAGERFPIYNPQLAPKLSPRPNNDLDFFQGILEGIATIEKNGYKKLAELGAPYPTQISTMGGGSINLPWQKIRQKIIGVPIHAVKNAANSTEAAYGSALLAKLGANNSTKGTQQ